MDLEILVVVIEPRITEKKIRKISDLEFVIETKEIFRRKIPMTKSLRKKSARSQPKVGTIS